ncbi:MAG: SPOR domain-containing protein [Flavobacteriaceae bacterium]
MKKTNIFSVILLFFIAHICVGQQGEVNVYEDQKLTELLTLKSNLAKENKLTDGYTIQLYYGELKEANTIIRDYQRTRSIWPATIEYETPNYKVWVGNYATRLEADRALMEIKRTFPNAFVFRPDRKN